MFNCIAIIIVFTAHQSTNLMIYIIIAKRLQKHLTVLNTTLSILSNILMHDFYNIMLAELVVVDQDHDVSYYHHIYLLPNIILN